jgi:hypothetical protein
MGRRRGTGAGFDHAAEPKAWLIVWTKLCSVNLEFVTMTDEG